jgi:hypothetical protein
MCCPLGNSLIGFNDKELRLFNLQKTSLASVGEIRSLIALAFFVLKVTTHQSTAAPGITSICGTVVR